MLALLKLIQSIIKTPHSAGTPGQLAAATGRIQTEKQRLDEVEKQLKAELKRLTGGLAPGIELPKIKL